MKYYRKNSRPLFDINPVDKTGDIDFEKITHIKTQIDLRPRYHPVDELVREARLSAMTEKDEQDIEEQLEQEILNLNQKQRTSNKYTEKDNKKTQNLDENEIEADLETEIINDQPPMLSLTAQLVANNQIANARDLVLREFEEIIAQPMDPRVELIQLGASFIRSKSRKKNKYLFKAYDEVDETYTKEIRIENDPDTDVEIPIKATLIASIDEQENVIEPDPIPTNIQKSQDTVQVSSLVQNDMDRLLLFYSNKSREPDVPIVYPVKDKTYNTKPKALLISTKVFKYFTIVLVGAIFVTFSYMLVRKGEVVVTQGLEANGQSAILNLQYASQNLKTFDFKGAADNFSLAYENFNSVSGTLDRMGASLGSFVNKVPGLNKVGSANNLAEAGRSISKAGENMSKAFDTLSGRNVLTFLNIDNPSEQESISKTIKEFREVLLFADRNIQRAGNLFASVDLGVLPQDKKKLLSEFQNRIPEFEAYIDGAVDYADLMLSFVGDEGTKQYLVMFQNNTERRATGGFSGTYGLVTFENGYLKKLYIGDIYEIDGQVKQNVIPPAPIQHITPNYGMRDSAWFADFPLSARKIQEYYILDGGAKVDGVLSITPTVIERILDIVGPIEMPEYGMTLTSANFLQVIQQEVEVDASRTYPKQVVVDFAPILLSKLGTQNKDIWLRVFEVILEAGQQKHILAYFDDPKLQDVVSLNGLDGKVRDAKDDYLQVVFTNIKGSKTDKVTENSMRLNTSLIEDRVNHTLTIERRHSGGNSKYDFYNETNYSYVRVYVPRGSNLVSITGNTQVNHKPLINHASLGFRPDIDVAKVESTIRKVQGIDVFEESDKTVFGFWQDTKPLNSTSVTIQYILPHVSLFDGVYDLLWQKQSGSVNDRISINFIMPPNRRALNVSNGVQLIGNNLIYSSELSVDREIKAVFN